MSLFESEFAEHMAVAAATRAALGPAFRRMLDAWLACIRGDSKILFFGNGGSASDAQRLATGLTIRYARTARPSRPSH
jgi:D-sedoheptulose 7-phosphate isomerase